MKLKKSNKKVALIFGITGQDGAYLARFLLQKNYIVHGIKRRSSSINTKRVDDIYEDINEAKNFFLHYGDVTDGQSVNKIINHIKPTEIYNLAAQSHVAVSFELPEYTFLANALGVLKILESIKNIDRSIKFYQAGTSEMFGASPPPQNENTPFYPRSPYAVSKVSAHWLTINYREAYNIHASNGILFNHESPLRGETFVTKKIIKGLVDLKYKKINKIYLGNLYSKRDWGHAKDYVEAMWLMLQQKNPSDYVISTGKQYTVKEFINFVSNKLDMKLDWKGKGINEKAYLDNKPVIVIKNKYFRPTEVDSLKGNPLKAYKILKWKPKTNIHQLVDEMIQYEINKVVKF